MKKTLVTLVIDAIFICVFASANVQAAEMPQSTIVTTTQQGLHRWQGKEGTLIWIAGTEADVITYRRSFTFYFKSKTDEDLVHVPIVDGPDKFSTTWFSASRGETTNADAVVVAKNGLAHLVTVSRENSGKSLKVVSYLLAHGDSDYPDGPATIFKKVSSKSLAVKNGQDIDNMLLRKLAARH